jgi:hypothetical protein
MIPAPGKKYFKGRIYRLLLAGSFDSIVLWARDHALYRTIVDEVTAQSNVWMN